MTMARRRHTPEQVIPKLREADWLKRIVADKEPEIDALRDREGNW
jgi:hypothetical protein